MPFKLNISEKGKTYKLEVDTEFLIGKKIGDKIEGKEIKPELEGYELEITGTSDKAGFPGMKEVEGEGLRRVLLTKGWGMKKRPRKEGKGKPRRMQKGLRLRKTVRGNTISRDIIQINLKVLKTGDKKLEEIFKKTGTERATGEVKAEEKVGKAEEKEKESSQEQPEQKQEEKNPEEKGEKKEENK